MEARNILSYILCCETFSFCIYYLAFKSGYYTAVQRKMWFFCLLPQNSSVVHIHPQIMLIKAQILGETCPHLTTMLPTTDFSKSQNNYSELLYFFNRVINCENQESAFQQLGQLKKKKINDYKIWSDDENHCISISKIFCFMKFLCYYAYYKLSRWKRNNIQFILVLSICITHQCTTSCKATNCSITIRDNLFCRKSVCMKQLIVRGKSAEKMKSQINSSHCK